MRQLFLAAVLFAAPLALAQPKDGTMTPEEECMLKCGDGMSRCMMGCTGANPDDAAKPENRDKLMACMKKCADQHEPCLTKCENMGKKKGGK